MAETKFGQLGFITYKRTYARPLKDGKSEEFNDTIDRVITACNKQLKVGFNQEEEWYLRYMMNNMKGMVAGRFLWQLGTSTVNKLGLLSLQNCASTVIDHPIRPFTWAMDALMLGSGVGYNIQQEHVYTLPKVRRVKVSRKDTKDADFIVPDSREGWVSLLDKLLTSHFYTGKGFTYSAICIRSKGAPIKGFGGTASGPEELCNGMQDINEILNKRAGKKMRPIDCLDIMNIIGSIVVAGNVRRSAQIALGDASDGEFLSAKRWDIKKIPNHRAMSNNSVICNDINELPEEFWEGYKGNGEPYGLINLNLSQKVGRIYDGEKYPDPDVIGYNPCAEQSLAAYETCCLAEVFLPNIETKKELLKVVKILYRINKHSLALKCHHKETQDVVHKHMRMGIGVTGYLQATEKQRGWLKSTYEALREFDKEYSAKHGWPESIKLTTVKPSGTLSILAGVTSGVHPAYSQWFIRRIRMASGLDLVEKCKEHGYKVEAVRNFDGTEDKNTVVVEFPCSYPEGTVLAKDCTAVQQLEYVKRLQHEWSDNSVSCTVYYKKKELKQIKKWLKKNYNDNIKSVSFLLHQDHGFDQAPFEEITKKQYDELMANTRPITSIEIEDEEGIELEECASGACPIK